MFLELLVGLITFLFIWDHLRKRPVYVALDNANIKGEQPLPILGNALLLLGHNPETIFSVFEKLRDTHGKCFYLWVLHQVEIFTSDVRDLESLLSNQQAISKNSLYNLLHPWLGTGLLMSTGKKWHSRRKIITPTFHFKILDQFSEVFDQQSSIMVKQLYQKADGKTVVDMFPVVCSCALDIIAETAMGVKINAQTQPKLPYVQSVKNVAEITAKRFMTPIQRFELTFKLFAPVSHKSFNESIQIMHEFTDDVIEKRRAALQKSIDDGTYVPLGANDGDIGTKKRMALLDVLLQSTVSGQALSNADIREEVDTFMFEGHDTTTSGICYTLYLLARHPEIQNKLFEEIRTVFGDDADKTATMSELGELKYLELVIKESLRMYPPVPMIGRHTTEETVINGKKIPAKTNVVMLLYQTLRDPEYFKNPNTFDPERFNTESAAHSKIDPFSYVPFSAGPRNCIGQKFAMLEMKSAIAKIMRHFELLPLGKDVVPLMNLILRSGTGMQMGLKPRIYS